MQESRKVKWLDGGFKPESILSNSQSERLEQTDTLDNCSWCSHCFVMEEESPTPGQFAEIAAQLIAEERAVVSLVGYLPSIDKLRSAGFSFRRISCQCVFRRSSDTHSDFSRTAFRNASGQCSGRSRTAFRF